MTHEKLCIFCNYFGWASVSGHEYWGIAGGALCGKRHFEEYVPYNEEDLRELLLRAQTCTDYDQAKP